jgi:acyl carrier protein
MNDFLFELAELLEVEITELRTSYQLEENENWDSLALISIMAMVDEHFNISISTESLRKCSVLGDLIKLVDKNNQYSIINE